MCIYCFFFFCIFWTESYSHHPFIMEWNFWTKLWFISFVEKHCSPPPELHRKCCKSSCYKAKKNLSITFTWYIQRFHFNNNKKIHESVNCLSKTKKKKQQPQQASNGRVVELNGVKNSCVWFDWKRNSLSIFVVCRQLEQHKSWSRRRKRRKKVATADHYWVLTTKEVASATEIKRSSVQSANQPAFIKKIRTVDFLSFFFHWKNWKFTLRQKSKVCSQNFLIFPISISQFKYSIQCASSKFLLKEKRSSSPYRHTI